MKEHYDVVIVGGGMSGAVLACAMAAGDLSIAVLERNHPPDLKPSAAIDLRVSALTRASQRILESLQVWPDIAASRIGPFGEMRVWDAAGWGQIHFDAAAIGEPLLGWIIENKIIQAALWQKLQRLPNVDLCSPLGLETIASVHEESVRLTLSDGSRLTARLLVGADGGRSKVRELAAIPSSGWQYGQKAVVTTVTTEYPHQQTAWQRFLPDGPLAFLPLHDGRCSIVWSTLQERADTLLTLPDQAFNEQLAAAFDWRLGDIMDSGERASFNLSLQHAQSYVSSRIALIGDAAHVVHPLAGQGANLGFLDAAALAEIVLSAEISRRDIGSLATLRRYERWRKGDNLLMLGILDGFKRLFGSSLPPLRLLRNTGLNLTDALTPVKNRIMRQAMGLSGDLPKLARVSY